MYIFIVLSVFVVFFVMIKLKGHGLRKKELKVQNQEKHCCTYNVSKWEKQIWQMSTNSLTNTNKTCVIVKHLHHIQC